MIIENDLEQQDEYQVQEPTSEEVRPLSPSKSPQSIVFPYIGPPGAGPGLLGSRPGVGNIEYLIALEQHATSLKSALAIAASLKNTKNKNVDEDVEMIYDSMCNDDVDKDFAGHNLSAGGHMLCRPAVDHSYL